MKMVACNVCGEYVPHHGKGMCKKCYMRIFMDAHKHEKHEYDARRYMTTMDSQRGYSMNYHAAHPTYRFLGKTLRLNGLDKAPTGYVWHHTCYDHADPEANMVLMTRSSHAMGHRMLEALGIRIPHTNVGGDQI